ncbi:hypothetical protein B0H10DRAFT_2226748 [Mycena sp. CBHHK59/15]|nr:hypothetical protein B0H10DRAFT_2226748 [Mycena sp. CBHHK59/15]
MEWALHRRVWASGVRGALRRQALSRHKGGDFDDHFYRHTLAPNVMHFLRMKEKMETAFDLTPRGKTHGLPHLRNEFQQLLRMHKEDQLHLFRPGRSMGYAAVNFFERGYEKLEDTQLTKFIRDSTAYADITKYVLDGQEHDDWDEEQQRKYDQMQQNTSEDSDSEDESETESMAGDNSGDPGIRGIDFSDDESESDGETLDFGAEEPNEDLEGDEEDEASVTRLFPHLS